MDDYTLFRLLRWSYLNKTNRESRRPYHISTDQYAGWHVWDRFHKPATMALTEELCKDIADALNQEVVNGSNGAPARSD